ncbi:MAG: metalloregulator ArsR/SmtB family transcription factor [Desulfobulbus sp.]|nr:metalloregulator ArsR/SmtB family transcription factor [Desulfobulbus sp.]
MKTFLRVMKALSDPNRVRIIKLLENNALCVCEIQEALGLAQPTVSSHMKILEDAGLVEKERQGTWMIYRQADGQESVYAGSMLATLKDWLNEDPELRRMKAALPETTCQRAYILKSEA